jgi:hypothetical protein
MRLRYTHGIYLRSDLSLSLVGDELEIHQKENSKCNTRIRRLLEKMEQYMVTSV